MSEQTNTEAVPKKAAITEQPVRPAGRLNGHTWVVVVFALICLTLITISAITAYVLIEPLTGYALSQAEQVMIGVFVFGSHGGLIGLCYLLITGRLDITLPVVGKVLGGEKDEKKA